MLGFLALGLGILSKSLFIEVSGFRIGHSVQIIVFLFSGFRIGHSFQIIGGCFVFLL